MRGPAIPLLAFFFSCAHLSHSQPLHSNARFTHQDTLRGTITPERAWWDVVQYKIAVTPNFLQKTIAGSNLIRFRVLKPGKVMQVDLQPPLNITSIEWKHTKLTYNRDTNVFFVKFPHELAKGSLDSILVHYEGKPREAVRPPWDGGWIWKKDSLGRPWMSVACQGLGASIWYPCKDHQSDEPDSAQLSITVADTLVAVGNGRLRQKIHHTNGTTTFTWAVTNPINNYDIIPYIGKYAGWHEDYAGLKGTLDCNFWVLDYNLPRANIQFRQAFDMLKCFEYWFGPYPFYEDGYKLVEAPHLGMEHQSAVAYGNKYMNGYLGRDLSGTGWGAKWDFIIVHESGHEWFGNNITSNDLADMWVHEGFTNYSETLFTTCMFGTEAGNDYAVGTRRNIRNNSPVIGPYGVNHEGSTDMYDKGGNLLHTIRQVINDDSLFRKILTGLNREFYHKTVDSKEVEEYISKEAGKDFSTVFNQYLRTTKIPTLQYKWEGSGLSYRWSNTVPDFNLPVKVNTGGLTKWIKPSGQWQHLDIAGGSREFRPDRNFYIYVKEVSE